MREGVSLRRFRPAPLAAVLLDQNKLVHLCSTQINSEVVDQRGPYFLSGNWWDETSWSRREWDVQLENGVLCRCHQSGEKWELDGIYD